MVKKDINISSFLYYFFYVLFYNLVGLLRFLLQYLLTYCDINISSFLFYCLDCYAFKTLGRSSYMFLSKKYASWLLPLLIVVETLSFFLRQYP